MPQQTLYEARRGEMLAFEPHAIDIDEARAGDIIVWKGDGLIYQVLSWLIKSLKEHDWDRWGWHTTPMISSQRFVDALFPKIKISKLTDARYLNRECRVYRIFECPPVQSKINKFVKDKVGCPYDFLAYPLTALALLLRPRVDIPRIINKRFHCWETTWEFADECGCDITDDYHYPFLTDLLRLCGELH